MPTLDTPNRKVVMPTTVPLPGLKAYHADQEAQAAAEEAAWTKSLQTYEAAKSKAEAEGKEAPKPPVRPVAKKDEGVNPPIPTPPTHPDLVTLVAELGADVEEAFELAGEQTCQVKKEALLKALTLLRNHPQLGYEMLADQTAVHYPAAQDFAFAVVYHVSCLSRGVRLRIRILIPEGFEPDSATAVYPGANWLEREIFDMFGIRFAHHPDMTRILCPDDWEGHPLRKEYPVVGLGQRDIELREDREGRLYQEALKAAGHMAFNLKPPKAN